MWNKRFFMPVLFLGLTALFFTACSEDEEEPQPEQAETGAPYQIMVVFAPEQLGDRGYADNVMSGVGELNHLDNTTYGDSLNVQFISVSDRAKTCEAVKTWSQNRVNPYYNSEYRRRLLILTEPYMVDWIADIKDNFGPQDGVLLLKVNEADRAAAAASTGLGNRLHGLNISAAEAAHKFAAFIRAIVINSGYYESVESFISESYLPLCRLYNQDIVSYRDSVYEALADDFGPGFVYPYSLVNDLDTDNGWLDMDIFSSAHYLFTLIRADWKQTGGVFFSIVDFGSGNAGWDIGLGNLGVAEFFTLALDSDNVYSVPNRYYIQRDFGSAIVDWCLQAITLPPGSMPAMTEYSGGELCTDNIPDYQ